MYLPDTLKPSTTTTTTSTTTCEDGTTANSLSCGRFDFASDNCAGIIPGALEWLIKCNKGFCSSYSTDRFTRTAKKLILKYLGTTEARAKVFLVTSGTAGNALSLAHTCPSYGGIICHPSAHINTEERAAPQFFAGGGKLHPTRLGKDGKISLQALEEVMAVHSKPVIHYSRPKVLSVTQASDTGEVYTREELFLLCKAAKRTGLRVHMDGARFANAVASEMAAGRISDASELCWNLGVDDEDDGERVGVDVLVLGGAKNGLGCTEAVVFFDKELAKGFKARLKQSGQLVSKTRTLSAFWIGAMEGDAFHRYAQHANNMATYLYEELKRLRESDPVVGEKVGLKPPPAANAIFVELDSTLLASLKSKGWEFYTFAEYGGSSRLMCSWQTTKEGINELVSDIAFLAQRP